MGHLKMYNYFKILYAKKKLWDILGRYGTLHQDNIYFQIVMIYFFSYGTSKLSYGTSLQHPVIIITFSLYLLNFASKCPIEAKKNI